MQGRDDVLSVRDLEIGYTTDRGKVQAVRGVSFDLGDDESLAFIGESGSGKTTLGLSLVRLLPQNASIASGEIVFRTASEETLDLTTLDDEALRRFRWGECAMVFQSALNALNPVMRIRDHFADTAKDHGETNGSLKGHALTERATECLQMVQLDPDRVLGAFPHELSGGMRQRVMIAVALACGPKLLFADEPTTALDVTVQAQILDLLQDQQRERFMAMILVTHDLGVVAGRADDIAVMYAGRIVEKAPTRTLFREMRHPYSEALLESIPKLEAPNHTRLAAIGGRPPDLVNLPRGCKFAPRCPNVQDKCRQEEPPLIEHGTPGHEYACYFPVGSREGAEARARNLAAGVNVTVGAASDPAPAGRVG